MVLDAKTSLKRKNSELVK